MDAVRGVTAGRPASTDPGLPGVHERDPRRWVRFIAAAALVLLGLRINIAQGVEVGFVVAVVLAPVWFRAVREYRWAWAVLGAGLLAALSGWWLGFFNAARQSTDTALFTSTMVLFVGSLLSFGMILWARRVLYESNVALWYGVGLALGISPSTALFASNPWKFGFALPATIILLALAWRSGKRWLDLVLITVLTLVSALTDSRSSFAILLFAVIVVAVQLIPRRTNRRLSALRVVIGLGGLGAVVVNLGQALILDGALGEATQARSLEQLRTSGSLILGGRPELAATTALMQHQPWGYGAGAVPNLTDIMVAKQGMASINYQPDNGYVEDYMFGGHIELHSVFGDLWAHFGIPGLVFLVVVLIVVVWGLSHRIAAQAAPALVVYASGVVLWGLFFSPFYNLAPLMMVVLALSAVPAVKRARAAAQPRTYSRTSSIGPVHVERTVKPAVAKTSSSGTESSAG